MIAKPYFLYFAACCEYRSSSADVLDLASGIGRVLFGSKKGRDSRDNGDGGPEDRALHLGLELIVDLGAQESLDDLAYTR